MAFTAWNVPPDPLERAQLWLLGTSCSAQTHVHKMSLEECMTWSESLM